jgi:cyclohexyl-isocyanide hydratase
VGTRADHAVKTLAERSDRTEAYVGRDPFDRVVRNCPDRELLQFLADRGKRAKFITSVCSGSLVLAAGLLDGYRATTHWALYDELEAFSDVTPVRERVVSDRNRVTGGGVTAGIDFGLTLLAQVKGEHFARLTQLMIEYSPAPPFDAGSPEGAGRELTAQARAILNGSMTEAVQIARAIAAHR